MNRFFIILFVLLTNLLLTASPQVDSTSEKINHSKPSEASQCFLEYDSVFSFHSPKGYVPSLLSDIGEQATAPFRFKTKQWLITGASIGITAAIIHFDDKIDVWADVQMENHKWVNRSSPVITTFGSISGISTIAAIGLLSAAFKNQKGTETSLLASQALITSEVWVQLMKLLRGKEHTAGHWWGPFPSGHTAAAFSMATVFALQYRNTIVIPVFCYSLATLVGISRITEQAHWASDVFVGGLIGFACGVQVVNHHRRLFSKQLPGRGVKPELSLTQYGNQIGFVLKW
jgi:hypothetical protein